MIIHLVIKSILFKSWNSTWSYGYPFENKGIIRVEFFILKLQR